MARRPPSRRAHDPAPAIASLDLFACCSPTERELVARLATLADVKQGTKLCAAGEEGHTFYVLVEGEITVTIDGREVATLGPGCGFGEIALLRRGGRRIADVTTSTPARLVVFSRPEFATLMAELPRLAHEVMDQCRRRLAVAPSDASGPWVTS
jgi:CRP-like cAMP-binding protein